MAAAIGAPDTVVPTALPTTPPGPIAGASVVVVLGTDLASITPTAGDHHHHRRDLELAQSSRVVVTRSS